MNDLQALTRRHFFKQTGFGLGGAALASLMQEQVFAQAARTLAPSVAPKAKMLGSPFDFRRHGQSGQEISDLLPHLTTIADDIAIVPRPITSSRARRATWPQGAPVISVDTKKRELVGDLKNAGQEWAPAGTPEHVRVHDFPSDAVGKAIPYGVYDMARTEAWVNVGRDHDTPAFAVAVVSKASSVQTRRANHERPHHRWPRAWRRYPPPAGRAPCTALRSPRTAIASTPWCASRRGG